MEEGRWKLYFDGSAHRRGAGAGIVMESPEGEIITVCKRLMFAVTNNQAEYEACILGLDTLAAAGAKKVEVIGDSKLVIEHAKDNWVVRAEGLLPYIEHLKKKIALFDEITFTHVGRSNNRVPDALANLASAWQSLEVMPKKPFVITSGNVPCHQECFINEIGVDTFPWFYDILAYMRDGTFPDDASKADRIALQRMASKYVLAKGELYKRSWDGVLLRCVSHKEGKAIMQRIHEGVCGTHMSGKSLARKIMNQGYFWISIERDCIKYVRTCKTCQYYDVRQHLPATELHPTSPSWPFSAWGIDVIGKIHPPASNQHQFILVAVDYFSRWVEARSYRTLGSKQVANFIEKNIFCRYGVPHHIVTDNGSHFQRHVISLLQKYKVEHHTSSPYRPQANGAVEAANKEIKRALAKMTTTYRDWANKLPFVLWGHRTTSKSVNGSTPYELVYGMEAVLPVELELQSLRVTLETSMTEQEWVKKRYEDLAFLDGRRLEARYRDQLYKRRIARHYNKRLHPRAIQVGDLVLMKMQDQERHPGGKFKPNWEGPYVVKKLFSKGAVQLATMSGILFSKTVNLDQLRKFYV